MITTKVSFTADVYNTLICSIIVHFPMVLVGDLSINITAFLLFYKQRHALRKIEYSFLHQKSFIPSYRITTLKQLKKTYSFMLPRLRENDLLSKTLNLIRRDFKKYDILNYLRNANYVFETVTIIRKFGQTRWKYLKSIVWERKIVSSPKPNC